MADIHRFRDRAHAGALLARQLRHHAHAPDAIVLALPRGGVPVGFAIAMRLGIALDVLVVRKLGMPRHEELAMGAVGSGGVRVLQPGVPGLMGVTEQDIAAVTARELAELARRELAYRGMPDSTSAGASGTLGGARAAPDLRGKTAIVVDDGIATGSTMQAAIQVVRRMQPRSLVLAIPVAPPDTMSRLAPQVDELVCLSAPPLFRSVGEWYDSFDQTSDAQVQALLAAARQAASDPPTGGPKNENADDG
jgi:putative phosphoribosyl transferase